jgi:hypothetical protein
MVVMVWILNVPQKLTYSRLVLQLMVLWGSGGNFRRWGLVGESKPLKRILRPWPLLLSLFLKNKGRAMSSSCAPRHDVLPHHKVATGPSDHELKPLKL